MWRVIHLSVEKSGENFYYPNNSLRGRIVDHT